MNDKIKELAEQAGFFPMELTQVGTSVEKFAQLIVKETMQVVANQLPSNQYLDVANAVIEYYKDH
jgi:hypothetical protein